jgi:hypothetical protein
MSILTSAPQEKANPTADNFVQKLERIHNDLRHTLREAQVKYKQAFDAHVKESPPFRVGDLVWLSRKHIKTSRPSSKLDAKRLGPFKILEVVGEAKSAYKLELPPRMEIHPVFHVSLLTPYRANTIPSRIKPPLPAVVVDGAEEYEVDRILDSRIRHQRLEYLVDWTGYSPDERTWEAATDVMNAGEALEDYHREHPNRPSPRDVAAGPLHRSAALKRGGTVRTRS